MIYSDTSIVRNYTLRVPNPGIMAVQVSATDVQAFDAQKLTSIEVELKYGDPGKGVPEVVEKVILTKTAPQVTYRRPIYASWDQPYSYRATYVVNDDSGPQRITGDWIVEQHDPNAQLAYLSIGTPFDNLFHLTVLPSVDWSQVQTVLVDLDYADQSNDYRQSRTVAFDQASAAAIQQPVWKFPLRDADHRGYRYSVKILDRNGAVKSADFVAAPTDASTLIVGDAQGGVASISVDPGDTGVGGAVRRVVVRLRYADPANSVLDETALAFRDAAPQTWTIARADAGVNGYTYDVDYMFADGTTASLRGQTGTITGSSDFLFVPAPVKPEAPQPVPPAATDPSAPAIPPGGTPAGPIQ